MHAAWQQEIHAAHERSRKWVKHFVGGLVEVVNPEAETIIIASGSAVSQSREALRQAEEMGKTIGLIKVKSLRPFPHAELRAACRHVKRIIIPEFNCPGWLNREVRSALYGHSVATIADGPRVYGGITMPTELILEWLFKRE